MHDETYRILQGSYCSRNYDKNNFSNSPDLRENAYEVHEIRRGLFYIRKGTYIFNFYRVENVAITSNEFRRS